MAEKVLISAENIKLSIGRQVLFNGVTMAVNAGERVALIGRNGSGKSTLIKILAGLELPADGIVAPQRDLRTAILAQDFQLDENLTVSGNVRTGLAWFEKLHALYSGTGNSVDHDHIEHLLTVHDAWHLEDKLGKVCSRLGLPDDSHPVSSLSGGEKRRVALARAIISEPDLLFLDEPTNHLDVATIEDMEDILVNWRGSCLFVTHDRYFLDRIATRILELDHGEIYSYNGSYGDYLEAKAARETLEDIMENKRRKFLRDEIEWVRRSPKARLKRNMGRIKRFEEISAISAPERTGEIELVIPPPPHLGDRVVEMKDVSHAFGSKTIFRNLDFEFLPGCRMGIVGGNGVGKTTLLQLISGKLAPDSGEVKIADTVVFNYVDQMRLALDQDKTVEEEIGEGKSFVEFGGTKITIWTYLKRFLFEDERIRTQIRYLSGGEKARLILAKILKQGGNFLILDEPTNDLDLSSLRLLEEALAQFPGCVAVVSHDRYFLNRVCTHIVALEGDGTVFSMPGDYDYYLSKRQTRLQAAQTPRQPIKQQVKNTPQPSPVKKRKLTYKEALELKDMEENIAKAEAEVETLETMFCDPDFFRTNGSRTVQLQAELDAAKAKVEALYARWEELEKISSGQS